MEKSAGQARIFDNNERTVFAKTTIKQGTQGWSGVAAHTTVTRTCDLELPRGHATVKCGRFDSLDTVALLMLYRKILRSPLLPQHHGQQHPQVASHDPPERRSY